MTGVAGSAALWCMVAGRLAGGDPLLIVELLGGGLIAAWTAVGAWNVWLGHRLARRLTPRLRPAALFGIRVELILGGGGHAFVLGAIRPRIFVGEELLTVLDPGELRAVLLHEDHHRRTLAPLRSAALDAWLTLLGRWERTRVMVDDRLTDLEVLADAEAIRRGAAPATLASALVKCDRSLGPAASEFTAFSAFSRSADRRIESLLGAAAERPVAAVPRLPYEWLPPAVLALLVLGCHATGALLAV